MGDPMAELLSQNSNPYGASRAHAYLTKLFGMATPEVLAHAAEDMLRRIVLLESFIENELNLHISEEELTSYLEKHHLQVDEDTGKLASLFFGKIARREGG